MGVNKPVCKGRHQGHLCVLVSEKKFDEIRTLVTRPRFLCFNCGRAANSARNLCNPMPLASGGGKPGAKGRVDGGGAG